MKPRIQDAIETVMAAVGSALAAANVPAFGQIVAGQPVGTALINIMGQSTTQGLITVFPRPGTSRDVSVYPLGTTISVTNLVVPLIATATAAGGQWTLTFTGRVIPDLNIHTILSSTADAFYQTNSTDTLNSVATAVAAAVNALGFSATPSANTVVVTNSALLICNVGGGSTTARLVSRVSQQIQVSIWVPDPHATPPTIPAPLRFIIAEAIMDGIGTMESRSLALSSGPPMDIEYMTEYVDDQAQSDYSVYTYHIVFHVEYDTIRYTQATQIGAAEVAMTEGNGTTLNFVVA